VGAFSDGVGRSKNINFTVNDPTIVEKVPEKYIVILEEPDSTTIVSEHFKSNTSSTSITLSGDSKIDQIGRYFLTVFSENTTPAVARSLSSKTVEFTTDINTFAFSDQEAFTEYSNISIKTNFNSTFDNAAETGVAQNSFIQNDPSINTIVDLEFEDIFGNSGFSVQRNVLQQEINILDFQGNEKSGNFKTLTNDSSFSILNAEVNEMFGYTGDERYRVPSGLNFEVNSFQISIGDNSREDIFFEGEFNEPPAVFIQQKVSGSFNDIYRPLGRQYTKNDGTKFFVKSLDENPNETHYTYMASQTGSFTVDGKKIEIDFVSRSGVTVGTGYQAVEFNRTFGTIPTVVIQLQEADTAKDRDTSETCITGVSNTGFYFAAFQDNNQLASGTGKYAYIAAEELAFNNAASSDLPISVLNYASDSVEDYSFGTPILNEFNNSESSVTDSRFNHDQYLVLCQRSGEDANLEDKFFAVHETGNQNKLYQHMLTSGLDTGIRASQTDGANNHILLTGTDLTVGTKDFTMFAWAKFDSSLDGKQYLLESHNNGTGIAWFQSGDGKNYVNLNGVEYLAITGAAGASLNDGNLHALYVEVTRDTSLKGYVDGTLAITDTQIIERTTGFTVDSVGQGMPQNLGNFNENYTGADDFYQNVRYSGLRIKTSGSNNTWILVDEDPATNYVNTPIAWSGGENINHPANVSSWTGLEVYSGFTVANIGFGMSQNSNSFDGTYTGGVDLYQNTATSGLRLKQTGANNTWVFTDDDPANGYITGFNVNGIGSGMVNNPNDFDGSYTGDNNLFVNTQVPGLKVKKVGVNWILTDEDSTNTYFTGFTLGAVGSGMTDNPADFNGTYTGGADLFVNTITSGLRIRTSGATWVLTDDDPASPSYNGIAWSGGANVNFPGNVATWSGGASIIDLTITDSSSPVFSLKLSHDRIAWTSADQGRQYPFNVASWSAGDTITNGAITDSSAPTFDTVLSHDRIAWSGGENENLPWTLSNWTGGETSASVTTSAPVFSDIEKESYPGTSAPTFSNFLLEPFDAQTGFKILGNSELPGNSLTSGHIMKYIGLTTGQETQSTHFNSPNTYKNNKKNKERTKFLLEVSDEKYFEDISTDNTASGSIVGSVERSQSIINRNKLSNFNFLQIGVTGNITT